MRTAALFLVATTATAYAVVPKKLPLEAPALTAMPTSGLTKPLRSQRAVDWSNTNPNAAWKQFAALRGGRWQVSWDSATGVPSRIFGEGMPAPGAVADPAVAERFARQVLADHVALLAPGASVTDFELVSNHLGNGIRSIGFIQKLGGKRVVGGQVSFRFKADRLFVIGSEALPNIKVAVLRARLSVTQLRARAASSLRVQLGLPAAQVTAPGDEVVLPLVGDAAVLGYRLARPLTIEGGADGRYLAYADVATGAVIGVRQLNAYETGTVLYHSVDRYPGKGRIDRPAQLAHLTVNGTAQTATADGSVTWGGGDAMVVTSVDGNLAHVVTKAKDNPAAAATLSLSPGASAVWDVSDNELDDAQLNAYVAVNLVKNYIRANVDPGFSRLDDAMTVNVNVNQSCNAYWDGGSINFFIASESCENTGRILDVIYHEYGHHLHGNEIIVGVGDFDGAESEGFADFLAASVTGDHGMGRGFYFSDEPLRDIDPDNMEFGWPNDIGEAHHTGLIISGALWDLRKALIAKYGEANGIALVNKLFVGALRRSISIPSAVIEVLAEDDDDGNLGNGTPDECEILAAFSRHGLRTASGSVIAPGTVERQTLAIGVHIEVSGLSDRCVGEDASGAKLSWVPSYTGVPHAGSQEGTPAGVDTYFAQLPLAKQESVFYTVEVKFPDGSKMILADNLADPYYQLYQGETVKLYCTNFDTTNPFSEGWTTGTDDDSPSPFEWGVPTTGSTDPHFAYSGDKILAQKLDGTYNPKQRSWVKTPTIDVGQYSDVRVQYRRWLAVEDSHFDTALITANDKKAWNNYTADAGNDSARHHVDHEWRFHDVPLSGYFSGHELTVGWEITSDEGLELGGWQLDDVCIVANPYSVCGDGVRSGSEQCDKGLDNRDAPDICRTDCRLPRCGDNILDMGEECDVGPDGDYVCSNKCKNIAPNGDGCSAGGASGSWLLALALAGLAPRRRRRR